MPAQREFYTAEEYAVAKETNAAAFLMSIGYELTRESRCYKGKLHDSLVIRDDGRWYWNSRGLHGVSPIELYKHILLNDYGYTDEITAAIAAVKQLAAGQEGAGSDAATFSLRSEPLLRMPWEPLPLPARHKDNARVTAYLCATRGLDPEIVRGLIKHGKIYETIQCWDKEKRLYRDSPYHNAVFVAYDREGRPQNAFLRGTFSRADKPFKRDLDFSDKSYSFTLCGRPGSDRVFCFESAVDAISHASIFKLASGDWRNSHRLSLGGVTFFGLERFLSENPQVQTIVSCLDNDETGNRTSEKLAAGYRPKGYTVLREAPANKDFNEDLLALHQHWRQQQYQYQYENEYQEMGD